MHSKGVNTLLTVATMAAKMLMKVYYYGYVYIIPIEFLTVTCRKVNCGIPNSILAI